MADSTGPSRRASGRPITDRLAFKPIALLLLVPVVLASSGLAALLLAPPFAGGALAVHELDRRLTEAGADFTRIPRFPQRSTIYANDGRTELARIYLDNREIVGLQHVSEAARRAVLAIEDATFYEHGAVNWAGIVRAMIENLKAGEVVQGGSTISQQLVKNTLGLDPNDESFERKFQELALAMRVEERYPKERILGMYLNQVYLGNGVYGIGTASEFYFKKRAANLTLVEGALLAGMIRAPEYFDPIDKPRKALLRRNDVLNRMMALGWISEERGEAAKAKPLKLANVRKLEPKVPPFFVTYMREQIVTDPNGWYSALGATAEERRRALSEGGLEIVTTLDPDWQEDAEAAANRPWAIAPGNPGYAPTPDVGIVSIENETGAIRTLLSGRNFKRDEKELATTGHQPGSSFKPFVLASALEAGISPNAVYSGVQGPITDDRCRNPDGSYWEVINAEGSSRGNLTLAQATEDSVNAVFARLILDAGLEHTKEVAQRMGITTDIPAVCSMATGSVDVTPLEMASGYQTIANGGVHCRPYTVETIRRANGGALLYEHEPECYPVLKSAIAKEITQMLVAVVTSGTAAGAFSGWGPWPIAGKTGTADLNRHVWFVGFSQQVSTSVWVGSPGRPYPLPNYWGTSVFGGTIAAPIWRAYMSVVMQDLDPVEFPEAVRIQVPSVVGLPLPDARRVLSEARLTATVTVVDSAAPEGTVVSQSPGAGSDVLPGSSVALQVSNGVAPVSIVPNVVGLSGSEAAALIRSAGFGVAVVEQDVTNPGKVDRVLAQSPASGTELVEGRTVTITVGVAPGGGDGGGGGNGGGGGGGD
jgi:membrane peptidoglycan carboxypeptidase